MSCIKLNQIITTHIKIKKNYSLRKKEKKREQYGENITSIRFVGPLIFKKLLIHKISNLELIVKGVVTPLKCCPT